ncbi:hypothetical protein [Bradyrhizobium guangdongense]|uniref:Uncharacterized protein n=1 Tax=Bradyrhizobium guangdongense TaxID=1325090 RepID=A0AA87W4A1_9BRAD|nr:hypothetical protein [Bradyrhizobium guangdongense]GGI24309.1 hypothetical protein GCM10010987_28740 [Bradyrhizobium guangdongense]
MSLKYALSWVAVVLALYVPAAIYSTRSFEDPSPAGKVAVILLRPYEPLGGSAYRANLLPGEKALLPQQSDLVVYEEESPLRRVSEFLRISKGGGNFAIWSDQGIVFSSRDNSDPNRNGRKYWVVVRQGEPETVADNLVNSY